MSSEHAELVARGYEAWNRGDVEGVLAFLDAEIDWHGYTHIPESGALQGRGEVREWLERFLEAWEELEIELTELVDSGDQVVALVRFSGRGRGSGVQVEGGVDAHVWTVRDQKAVAVKMYQGTREALEAVGFERTD